MTRAEKAYEVLHKFHMAMENGDKALAEELFGEMYQLALNTWQADSFLPA